MMTNITLPGGSSNSFRKHNNDNFGREKSKFPDMILNGKNDRQ